MTGGEFGGRVAFVTGAAGGIGRGSALAFARRGAAVVVADVNEAGGTETVAQIEALGARAIFLRVDVTSEEAVAAAVNRTVEVFGALDFAHNNAGAESPLAPTDQTDAAAFDRSIAINLRGVFLCMKYELAVMKDRPGSVIVNTASVGGLTAVPNSVAYSAAKAGVIGMSRTVAIEYAPNVRCVALCPGLTRSGMTERLAQAAPDMMKGFLPPLGRMAEPGEMGEIAAWLCSSGAAYVTGQAIVADGGWTAI